MSTDAIAHLCKVQEYRQQRAHIFRSPTAVDWFIRRHKTELIESGALLMVVGQWFVNPEAADRVLADIGKRQAAGRVTGREACSA